MLNEDDDPKLQEFRVWLNQLIGSIVAKYAGRILWLVGTVSFLAGVWATKLQVDLNRVHEAVAESKEDVKELKELVNGANTATGLRIVDWSKWRVMKDALDDNYERRLAWLETVERKSK